MPDYLKGKIYKIICNTTGLVYIGSSCQPTLAKRLAMHRGDYKLHLNGKKGNITSFKVLENGDYEIVLIENYPCENKDELHKRERFHIDNNICVNSYIPTQTRKEHYLSNKEKIGAKYINYYAKNRIKILEHKSKHYDKERAKQYYENNKARYKKMKLDKLEKEKL